MNRIFYGFNYPTAFEEHQIFTRDLPYTIRIKTFSAEDIIPLHYSNTLEIMVCEDLIGEVTINKHYFTLGGKQVFIIPPYSVHSNIIHICSGTLYVIKIDFNMLSEFVNLIAILEYENIRVQNLSNICPDYEAVYKIVLLLIEGNDDLFMCMSCIINLFQILRQYTDSNITEKETAFALKKSDLRELITWTEQNYDKKISLDDVARRMGYSKCYFANLFKALTGTTYLNYLNSVRISHACLILQSKKSVTETCYLCGFENASYFVQLFKKIMGCTPKEYVMNSKGK